METGKCGQPVKDRSQPPRGRGVGRGEACPPPSTWTRAHEGRTPRRHVWPAAGSSRFLPLAARALSTRTPGRRARSSKAGGRGGTVRVRQPPGDAAGLGGATGPFLQGEALERGVGGDSTSRTLDSRTHAASLCLPPPASGAAPGSSRIRPPPGPACRICDCPHALRGSAGVPLPAPPSPTSRGVTNSSPRHPDHGPGGGTLPSSGHWPRGPDPHTDRPPPDRMVSGPILCPDHPRPSRAGHARAGPLQALFLCLMPRPSVYFYHSRLEFLVISQPGWSWGAWGAPWVKGPT